MVWSLCWLQKSECYLAVVENQGWHLLVRVHCLGVASGRRREEPKSVSAGR